MCHNELPCKDCGLHSRCIQSCLKEALGTGVVLPEAEEAGRRLAVTWLGAAFRRARSDLDKAHDLFRMPTVDVAEVCHPAPLVLAAWELYLVSAAFAPVQDEALAEINAAEAALVEIVRIFESFKREAARSLLGSECETVPQPSYRQVWLL